MDRVRSAPRHGGGLAARGVDTAAAGDIVVSVDGEAIDNLPRVAFHLFTKSAGDRVATASTARGRRRPTICGGRSIGWWRGAPLCLRSKGTAN